MEYRQTVKASEITGVKVKNFENENLGEINELVIDKNSGKVNYLVLDFGGFLSFGNKFFAVPWSLFNYDKGDDCFILNIDKTRLKDAPGFDKDKWPDFANAAITNPINQYYSAFATTKPRFTTELFNDKDSAEKAYDLAIQQGYKPEEINVMMSDESRKKYYASRLVKEEVGSKALKGMGVGSLVGGAVGGTLGAIAAIGTSIVFPGLGLIVAGPLAAGIAGVGAGGVSGGLIGALVGWGIPEDKAKIYESGIISGGIVLGVDDRIKDSRLEEEWRQYAKNRNN